jgi:uncharacterized protein (UPF0335 family)
MNEFFSMPVGHDPSKAAQLICKQAKRIAELEKEISNVTTNAKEVLADARNTLSVRKGFEMSGYVKHYIVSREDFNALKETK